MSNEIDEKLGLIEECARFRPPFLAAEGFEAWSDHVWWDRYHGVFVAKEARRTLAAIYGSRWRLPLMHTPRFLAGQLRLRFSATRYGGPFKLGFGLVPSDAVLRSRLQGEDGGSLVMCSASRGTALKMGLGRWPATFVKREAEVAVIMQDTVLRGHIPPVLDCGGNDQCFYWARKQLVPNSPPLVMRNRTKWWQSQLQRMLPVMWDFYAQSGTLVSNQAWADNLLGLLASKSDSEQAELQALASLVKGALEGNSGGRMMLTTIHGDFSPANIHVSKERWWVFDWACFKPACVLYDVVCHPCQSGQWHEDVWDWICGQSAGNVYPSSLNNYQEVWAHFMREWWGEVLTPELFRFQLLVMLLESHLRFRKDQNILAAIEQRVR